ncbi:hypothetical protein [Spirillospora sp. CA-294931]|uniref:hypothetical protein n=1 Tax=Spirillospora sp. CA-294931 TaxID=3240042 RepID=UPI003D94AD54
MSEQPTEPTTQVGEAEPVTEAPKVDDLQARIAELENDRDKYRSLMRKEEEQKKAHWDKLQEIERANLSETEKAILEAEERGKNAAKAEFESQLQQSKLQAAAAKAGVPEEVLGLLDPSKVFTEDGEPNLELLGSLSGSKRKFEKSASDLKIGAQSNSNAGQLTRADLQRMSPPEIMRAKDEGRLDALMRGQL